MEAKEIYLRLEKQFPGKVGDFKGEVPEPYCSVSPEAIVEISRFLRDDASLKFEVLSDLTALDWPKEEKIQVVYHLYSYSNKSQIRLKGRFAARQPKGSNLGRGMESGQLVRARGLRSLRRNLRRSQRSPQDHVAGRLGRISSA